MKGQAVFSAFQGIGDDLIAMSEESTVRHHFADKRKAFRKALSMAAMVILFVGFVLICWRLLPLVNTENSGSGMMPSVSGDVAGDNNEGITTDSYGGQEEIWHADASLTLNGMPLHIHMEAAHPHLMVGETITVDIFTETKDEALVLIFDTVVSEGMTLLSAPTQTVSGQDRLAISFTAEPEDGESATVTVTVSEGGATLGAFIFSITRNGNTLHLSNDPHFVPSD